MKKTHVPAGTADGGPHKTYATGELTWIGDQPRLRLLGARVLVRLVEEPQRGLIVTPDAHKPRAQRGVVVAVGTGREYPTTGLRIPAGVNVGETVVFNRYADERGIFGKFGGDELAAISQEEILCVLDPE